MSNEHGTASNTSVETEGHPRRSVLRAGLIAPVGATALAACGASEEAEDVAEPVADDVQASESAPQATGTSVPTSEIPVGGSTFLRDANTVIAQPTEGEFVAFDATCPHQGCAVSGASGGELICPCHDSTFNQATGEVVSGPATSGLTEASFTMDGDSIVLEEGR
ncbi:Rieske (2Fe-2S) protein [Ornithinimicrobium sp. Arc0846-15]|nr:Rieske (2Fe-2S) protein [Ornithinimicrobium laminariae]